MEKRRASGKLELPIISRSYWQSDDSKPIASSQLDRLGLRVKAYFSASPSTLYWETGIEENIKSRYRERYYWENLENKLRVVREIADGVNPDIKLIYQIAGLKQQAVSNFASSRASRLIDILSIHPYAWPDFPSPETWHDSYIQQARRQLQAQGLKQPIWYTEVGAPHHGNSPGAFFGYPEKNAEVAGLTPYQAVIYLVKLHVMALHTGIGKIFWYNYQDRHPERNHAENHFGLRDYWGHPKPVYVAYSHLHSILANRTAVNQRTLAGNIRVYKFSDNKTKVLVLWSFPEARSGESVALSALLTDLSADQKIEAFNSMGGRIRISDNSIRISTEPIFILITKP